MPRRVDPYLKWKVLGAFACVGVVLIGLMAYNLGHFNQDERDQRIHENIDGVNQMVRDRMALCQTKLRDRKADNDMDRLDVKQLQQETELLGRENELLLQTNDDLEASRQECEDEFARAMEQRGAEATTREVVQRLEFENSQLEITLVGFNNTKQEKRNDMKESIRALRLENKQLRDRVFEAKKAEQEEAALRRQIEEERRALQQTDIGIGERTADEGPGRRQTRHRSGHWKKYGKMGDLYAKMEQSFEEQSRSEAPDRDAGAGRTMEDEDVDRLSVSRG